MAGLWLSDAEVDDLCAPLRQPAAQVRFLRASGLMVTVKPNGRAAVIRSHAEAVLSGQRPAPAAAPASPNTGQPASPQPNVDGFMRVIQGGKRNAAAKKVQPA